MLYGRIYKQRLKAVEKLPGKYKFRKYFGKYIMAARISKELSYAELMKHADLPNGIPKVKASVNRNRMK